MEDEEQKIGMGLIKKGLGQGRTKDMEGVCEHEDGSLLSGPGAFRRHGTCVAEGALADAPSSLNGVDSELDVVDVVQRVKHAEDVHS